MQGVQRISSWSHAALLGPARRYCAEAVSFQASQEEDNEENTWKDQKYPFHKPEEKHSPGKDMTNKVSNVIEKAVNIAKSGKSTSYISKKVDFMQILTVTAS